MSFLSLDRVVKRFGAATVINGVSLSAEKGEFVVFVGPRAAASPLCCA